ncbi:hypothetical protein [Phenylobacterium aquaticum]|uniref:hypothetical protein n=1 Tax=Phenylobacterium aquaticum TaxID=1763816 RepID=UPI001F5CAD83|nr:hypothetical protein [Phenylobacterium aquaticum]MCI3134415.1 hypothetical protein [Phenylobacterium aquaticum]
MKTLTLIAATAALALSAGAASAQGWARPDERQAMLDARIEDGVRSGRLTWREARELRAEQRQIQRLAWRYRQDGMSGWERADLDRRFDHLSMRIRAESHDYDRYGDGYGYRR